MKIRSVLYLTLVLLTASFATAQIPCGSTPVPSPTLFVQWPQYHFDTNHSGCNPYESVIGVNTAPNLTLKWKFPTLARVSASPVVAGGIAYVGSWDEYLWAVDVKTGELLWPFWARRFIFASPVVADGMLYVASDEGRPYNLFALNARTGDVIWQYVTSGSVDRDSDLVVGNGMLYVGSFSGQLEAVNAKTGAFVWSHEFPARPSAAVAGGVVYVSAGYDVYALDANTGATIWDYNTGYSYFPSTPVVVNNVIYVGSGEYHVLALNAKTGTLIWTAATDGMVSSSPAVANGVVYVASQTSYQSGSVIALKASTGEQIWLTGIGGASSPIVANGVVYAGEHGHGVHALDAKTGAPLWLYVTGDEVDSSPVVANGVLYVTSEDYNLYAFSLPSN